MTYLADRPIITALLLGLLYFLVQFQFLADYGATWDEPLHRNWGQLFDYYRKTGDYSAITLMPGKGMYYGPLYYFLNFHLSEWLYQSQGFRFVAANHVLNLITTGFGVGLFYLLSRRVISSRPFEALMGPQAQNGWSVISATIFFALFPQLIAHAHYNPKDIPLMVGVLLLSLLFIRALQTGSRTYFLLSAFAFGLAITLKVSALLMAPIVVVSYLVWLHERGGIVRGMRSEWKTTLGAAALVLVGAYLFWPSAWTRPKLLIESLSLFTGADFWSGRVLFFGQSYGGSELPWYYIPFEYLTAVPLLVLIFFLAGLIFCVRKIRGGEQRPVLLYVVLWLFSPLLLSMKPGLVRYDGIRQFFFTLPAFMIIASVGFVGLVDYLHTKTRKISAVLIFSALTLASLLHEAVLLHPYQGSYRNEVMRAVIPEDLDHLFEIEYWGAPYKQGLDWLVEHAEPNAEICVPIAGLLTTWYPWRNDFTFDCSPETDYLMFITRYDEEKENTLPVSEPIFTIRRMNADLLKIYKV